MTEYDECQECGGYCCAVPDWIEFNYLDRLRVAKEFGMSVGQVTRELSVLDKKTGTRIMKFSMPCLFWVGGRCGIHHIKPIACQNWKPIPQCRARLLESILSGRAPKYISEGGNF